MIIDLLQMELDRMEGRKNQSNIHKRKKSKWTGSTIEATELVYAIFETKCINNGETDIKELVELLGTVIDLPDFDIYRSFIDIKNRKKNSTVFLDKMKQRLLDRINEDLRHTL